MNKFQKRQSHKEQGSPDSTAENNKRLKEGISWVAREIKELQKGAKLKLNVRRLRRGRTLLRMGRGTRGGLWQASLTRIKKKLRGLLRIKLAKERKRKAGDARKRAQNDFAKQGPRSLWPKQETKKHANVEEVREFWGGNMWS